jgi:hypothetical protein
MKEILIYQQDAKVSVCVQYTSTIYSIILRASILSHKAKPEILPTLSNLVLLASLLNFIFMLSSFAFPFVGL